MNAGGGVGGTSPVILTNASIPPHNSFNAVTGPMVKTSMLFGDGGDPPTSSQVLIASPVSAEGLGLGGRW